MTHAKSIPGTRLPLNSRERGSGQNFDSRSPDDPLIPLTWREDRLRSRRNTSGTNTWDKGGKKKRKGNRYIHTYAV